MNKSNFGPQQRHAARGSTTVYASSGKVKVRRINSGGARKFHLSCGASAS
jgi:hypothetical protein